MITIDMIRRGYEKGIVQLDKSPCNDGIVCFIGDGSLSTGTYCGNWFYFGGSVAAECKSVAEYTQTCTKEEIISGIFDALEDFRKEGKPFKDEYEFYESHLRAYGCGEEERELKVWDVVEYDGNLVVVTEIDFTNRATVTRVNGSVTHIKADFLKRHVKYNIAPLIKTRLK